LSGKIVTFDPQRPVIEEGVLYVGDGTIAAVSDRRDQAPAGFADTKPIDLDGVLYPGLIDLHSHILYNLRTLWAPGRAEPYTSHNQWPDADTYSRTRRRRRSRAARPRSRELPGRRDRTRGSSCATPTTRPSGPARTGCRSPRSRSSPRTWSGARRRCATGTRSSTTSP